MWGDHDNLRLKTFFSGLWLNAFSFHYNLWLKAFLFHGNNLMIFSFHGDSAVEYLIQWWLTDEGCFCSMMSCIVIYLHVDGMVLWVVSFRYLLLYKTKRIHILYNCCIVQNIRIFHVRQSIKCHASILWFCNR